MHIYYFLVGRLECLACNLDFYSITSVFRVKFSQHAYTCCVLQTQCMGHAYVKDILRYLELYISDSQESWMLLGEKIWCHQLYLDRGEERV